VPGLAQAQRRLHRLDLGRRLDGAEARQLGAERPRALEPHRQPAWQRGAVDQHAAAAEAGQRHAAIEGLDGAAEGVERRDREALVALDPVALGRLVDGAHEHGLGVAGRDHDGGQRVGRGARLDIGDGVAGEHAHEAGIGRDERVAAVGLQEAGQAGIGHGPS
jgi:hypothetical protein